MPVTSVLMFDHRSIEEMVSSLEQVTRQRKYLRYLHADRDAGDIAGCIQKLKQMIDSFLVSDGWSTSRILLRLIAAAGRKCDDVRDQSGRESEDTTVLVHFVNCLRRKLESK